MIVFTLNFTKSADKDEASIYKYISNTFGEIYAEKFRLNLIQSCNHLIKNPFIGRPAKNDVSLRVFIFNRKNKIVYNVADSNITIIRILNTKANLSSKF